MKQADFLPERIIRQRSQRQRLIRQGYLLSACVLCMIALAYVRGGRIAHARGELALLDERTVSQQRLIEKIPPLERQMAGLLIKKQIDNELGSRTDCTAVLAELCRLMPVNMSLVSLELKTVEDRIGREQFGGASRSARGTSKNRSQNAIRRVRLVLSGLAPTDVDVANFIGQLSASPLFEDVNMGYVKTMSFRGRAAREFQASCYLVK